MSGFLVSAGTASATTDGVLGVTQITAIKTLAAADGTYANGWSWVFDVTVPMNETTLNMKFADWVSGSNVITAGNHIAFYSAQSSNAPDAAHAITLTAANSYSGEMDLIPTSDLSANAGRQIQITVEAAVPVGSAGGSYSTGYGIQSNPDTTAPVVTLTGDNPQTIQGSTSYTELGATALDNVDGAVVVTPDASAVNVNALGSYATTYTATDAAGNVATTTRTVNVVDTAAEANAETAVAAYEAAPITTLTEVSAAEGLKGAADDATALVLDATAHDAFALRISNQATVISTAKTTLEAAAALAAAKVTAHAAIATALGTYTEGNYTADNWAALNAFATDGDTAVDAATDLAGVSAAQDAATSGMVGVQTIAAEVSTFESNNSAALALT
ncbi:MAG: immunoglobulin-like domain-containing protein, partial [Candidatus Staskawiczbacteria bacterium]